MFSPILYNTRQPVSVIQRTVPDVPNVTGKGFGLKDALRAAIAEILDGEDQVREITLDPSGNIVVCFNGSNSWTTDLIRRGMLRDCLDCFAAIYRSDLTVLDAWIRRLKGVKPGGKIWRINEAEIVKLVKGEGRSEWRGT